MGADAPACAALAGGADVKAFFVRKETKAHGLQRRIEGPDLEPGERCLIVEDVVTTGGSTVQAIEAVREAGYEVCGVVAILDRLAGGAEAIAAASGGAPYVPLATIDDVYPDRPGPVVRGSAAERQRRLGRSGFEPASGHECQLDLRWRSRDDFATAAAVDSTPYPAAVDVRASLTAWPRKRPAALLPRRSRGRSASRCSRCSARPSGRGCSRAAGSRTRCRGCSPPCWPARPSARPARCRRGCACPARAARRRRRARARRARLRARAAAARARRTGTSWAPASPAGSRR